MADSIPRDTLVLRESNHQLKKASHETSWRMNLINLARRCHGELSRLYQKHVWKPETSNCTQQYLWDIMFVPALDTCFWHSTPNICHDSHAILIIYVCEDRKQWVWPPICLLIWTSSAINSERLGIWNGCYVRMKFSKIWVCDEFQGEILYYNRPLPPKFMFFLFVTGSYNLYIYDDGMTWEILSALLVLYQGNPPLTIRFPHKESEMWALILCFDPEQAIIPVELLVICDIMTPVWRPCNVFSTKSYIKLYCSIITDDEKIRHKKSLKSI